MSKTRRGEPATLSDVVHDVALIDQLDTAIIPGLLVEIAALTMRLGARLAEGVAEQRQRDDDRLLDVAEAAEKLGVSADWLRRRKGKLPFEVRVGGAVRFSAPRLQAWIDSQRSAA